MKKMIIILLSLIIVVIFTIIAQTMVSDLGSENAPDISPEEFLSELEDVNQSLTIIEQTFE